MLISFNPTLILNKKLNVIGLESNFSPKDFIELGQITYKYSGKIFNKVFNFTMIKFWYLGCEIFNIYTKYIIQSF